MRIREKGKQPGVPNTVVIVAYWLLLQLRGHKVVKASSGSVEGFIGIGVTAKFRPQAATTYYPSSTRPGLRLPS